MDKCKCQICGEIFENIKIKANHVRWKHKTDSESYKIFSEKIKYFNINKNNLKLGEIKEFKVNCYKCGCEFEVKEREKQFPKKDKYYCSRSCANSRPKTDADKLKQSISAKNSYKVKIANSLNPKFGGYKSKYIDKKQKICICCNNIFLVYPRNFNTKVFCNIKCKNKYYFNAKSNKSKYKELSSFNFSLNNYPLEFEFDLIEKYGWYAPSNSKKPNINGVSRDHMLSVVDGFNLNINPLLLAHPANCKLMIHSENISKNKSSSITLDILLDRIRMFDLKYGKYYNYDIELYVDVNDLKLSY